MFNFSLVRIVEVYKVHLHPIELSSKIMKNISENVKNISQHVKNILRNVKSFIFVVNKSIKY